MLLLLLSEAIIIMLMQHSRHSRNKTWRKSFFSRLAFLKTLIASSFVYFFQKKNPLPLDNLSDEVWFGNIWWCCCCLVSRLRGNVCFFCEKISKSYLFSSLCILLTASLIAFPKIKKKQQNKKPAKKYTHKTWRQQIDQKSMEFQDKINKCHVDILLLVYISCMLSLSPWKCMLRKQHHLVNGNGIQHIHTEYIIEMLLLPKYKKIFETKKIFLLFIFEKRKISSEQICGASE